MAGDDNTLRPWFYSLAVHLAVLAIVSVSLWWTHSTVVVSIPGPIIEATLVGPAQAPAPKKVKPQPKKQPPKPEEITPKPEEPVQEKPKEDKKDQEKITDQITQQKADENARLQEELRKREQIELAEKQAAEAEKKKKLEEEKAKKARELAAKAEAEHMAAMIAEEARTGQEGTDSSLEAEYYAAIQSAVTNAWLRPETTPPGVKCTLEITQIIGGDVIQATVVSPCNADAATRTTLEQASGRASPLPYKGYESVFKRKIRFEFRYDG
ncbi:MAG: hypothetical protein JNN30_04565 [Rhodanobacteraceae bacterium]|nr:hypothetical protein [Rhodanobacteraceae bacterium]